MSTPDNNSLIIYSTDPDAGTVLAQVYVFYGLGLSNPQARFMYYAFLGDCMGWVYLIHRRGLCIMLF